MLRVPGSTVQVSMGGQRGEREQEKGKLAEPVNTHTCTCAHTLAHTLFTLCPIEKVWLQP